jgi:hypothetical protein
MFPIQPPLIGKLQEWTNTSHNVLMQRQDSAIYGRVYSKKWPFDGVHRVFMDKCDGPNDPMAYWAIVRETAGGLVAEI